MSQLSTIIEQAFEDRANFTAADCPAEVRASSRRSDRWPR